MTNYSFITVNIALAAVVLAVLADGLAAYVLRLLWGFAGVTAKRVFDKMRKCENDDG